MMQRPRNLSSRSHAAREEAGGRVFLLWIAAWALLTLSLFAFHGAGARDASLDTGEREIVRLAHAADRSGVNDTPVVSRLVGLY